MSTLVVFGVNPLMRVESIHSCGSACPNVALVLDPRVGHLLAGPPVPIELYGMLSLVISGVNPLLRVESIHSCCYTQSRFLWSQSPDACGVNPLV